MTPPSLRYAATVLDSPDPQALGKFYARLLGWEIVTSDPEWVQIRQNNQRPALSFQREKHYIPPVWPGEAGKPLMMMHLDLEVD
ncbi:MAG TPA: VOC family protein, partial [Thermomicrobiales bacterium]|nr:VOC family protein [Thermomicrobiales bacterium]